MPEPKTTAARLAGPLLSVLLALPAAAPAAADGAAPLVVFSAGSPASGYDLWASDGTGGGSRRVLDLPDAAFSFVYGLHPRGDGRAYFIAFTGGSTALWLTDGSRRGSRLVRDFGPGPEAAAAGRAAAPEPAGPRDGCTGESPPAFAALGTGGHVFSATTARHGEEPWVTDGSRAGTRRLADIAAGRQHSFARHFTPLADGRVLFLAENAANGMEPWVTDGTPGGTTLVRDINPGRGSMTYSWTVPTPLGDGRVVFQATDGAQGLEPWVSDGTAAGTGMIADINPGEAESEPSGFFPLGDGRVVFGADDGVHGRELWITDGSAGGTAMVADLEPGAMGSWPRDFGPIGAGRALFVTADVVGAGIPVRVLWVTDGTAAGTRRLAEIAAGRGAVATLWPRISPFGEGRALFTDKAGRRSRPWITDGTAAGTRRLTPTRAIDVTEGFCDLGDGRALFAGADGGLWITDGSDAGTVRLRRGLGWVADFTLLRAGGAP